MAIPQQQPPAGWYSDPESGRGLRWWDGAAWTDHRAQQAPDSVRPDGAAHAQVVEIDLRDPRRWDATRRLAVTFPNASERTPTAGTFDLFLGMLRTELSQRWYTIVGVAITSLLVGWLGSGITATMSEFDTTTPIGSLRHALGVVFLSSLPPFFYLVTIWRAARARFLAAWAAGRGFRHTPGPQRPRSGLPVFREGRDREIVDQAQGSIGEHSASVSFYTYELPVSEIGPVRSDRDERRHLTVVEMELPDEVARRFAGLSFLGEGLVARSFGNFDDAIVVPTESLAFDGRYQLWAAAGQDMLAAYELFDAALISRLLDEQVAANWQQQGSEIVFFRAGHLARARDLDDLCGFALRVYERYLRHAIVA